MALQGTLDTFALPDVLRLLATTAKTGRLHVDGDRGQGSVWLRDGTVMAAGADRAPDDATAEEVVFELLRFEQGSFAFQMGEQSPNGEQPEDVEILLRNAGSLLSEWNELKDVVPSLDHRVTVVDNLATDEVTIDADRWPILMAIAGSGRAVCDLAKALGMSELNVIRTIRDLVDLGVAEIEPPRERPRSVDRTRADRSRDRDRERDRSRTSPFSTLGSGETLATSPPPAMSTGEVPQDSWVQASERTSGSHAAISPEHPGALTPGDADVGSGPHASPALDPTQAITRLPSRDSAVSRRSRRPNGRVESSDDLGGGAGRSASLGPRGSDERRPPRRSAASSESPPRRRRSGRTPAAGIDGGSLGSAKLPADSGFFPPVGPPSGFTPDALAPDLQWAPTGEVPAVPSSPFAGAGGDGGGGAGGGGAPFVDNGSTAPHVAAMSDAARAAVQKAVGNGGGASGAPVPGDDLARRGQLINFLSSTRP